LEKLPIILFDGVCNFCNDSVNFIIDRDKKHQFYFASLQSGYAGNLLKQYGLSNHTLDSVVLITEEKKVYQKSNAALEIARRLSGIWPVFYAFKIFPRFIRDFFYDLIAKHRYKIFGRSEECRLPDPKLRERFLG
jgi:predicted DCC family thiol-disulfide oxidoreductase YuxK